MRVTPDGLLVRIPCHLDPSDNVVAQFVSRGLADLKKHQINPDEDGLSREEIQQKILKWAKRLDVEVSRIQIRPMKRKWGSISSNGNMTLTNAVLAMPESLVDYLIVHELAHLKFDNHGKGFQLLMDMTVPDWKKREKQLVAMAWRF